METSLFHITFTYEGTFPRPPPPPGHKIQVHPSDHGETISTHATGALLGPIRFSVDPAGYRRVLVTGRWPCKRLRLKAVHDKLRYYLFIRDAGGLDEILNVGLAFRSKDPNLGCLLGMYISGLGGAHSISICKSID